MKILFFMRNTGGIRNFEWTLRLLAERGHDVLIVADQHSLGGSDEQIERLCRECPTIRHTLPPAAPFSNWSFLGFSLRGAVDYLRYLDGAYADAPKLRRRAERSAPQFAVVAARQPLLRSLVGRRLMRWVFRQAARAVPREPALDALLAAEQPDLVLVTPLVEPGSPQSEVVRSARALGVRTGLCVYSWDNLTNKGLIQEPLDLVTVWNEPMKQEAVALHGVRAQKVVVTGAVPYDHWFTWQPRDSRDAFCARAGVRADRPYILYLCSSKFIAPDEVAFVRRWITGLRRTSSLLQEAGVLVRPHPQNPQDWDAAHLTELDNVAVWPRAGAVPVDDESRADYFDSITYSAAVVGVNTSAQIESAIVGRSVFTLLAEEFRETQEGTLHFQHLRDASGGLLHVAETFDQHAAQLEAALRAPQDDERCRRFVESFVRPLGREVAASSRLAAVLEAAAALGRTVPYRGPWWAPLARPVLARAATRLAGTKRARRQKLARRARLLERRTRERAAATAARAAARRENAERRDRQKQQVHARREAARAAEQVVADRAYVRYLEVRPHLQTMRERNRSVCLTPLEQRMVGRLAHLWDATPETIAQLRRHCEPVSGVGASEYDSGSHELRTRLGRERRVLRKQMPGDLFVSEPTVLGGFGIVKEQDRYNEDTLRFAKVLVALHDAALLGGFRCGARRLVWEIGGGWGGFAYQFKSVCPNVTYLLTGLAETLLLAAVYLETMFPDACIRYFAEDDEALWRDWQEADFIFVPEAAVATMRAPRLDLVLDIMALRSMTPGRVRIHVEKAFELGAPYFYSLLPSDSVEADARPVWEQLEARYWPHPIPPRVDRVPPVLDLSGGPPLESDFAHLVGWRRLYV